MHFGLSIGIAVQVIWFVCQMLSLCRSTKSKWEKKNPMKSFDCFNSPGVWCHVVITAECVHHACCSPGTDLRNNSAVTVSLFSICEVTPIFCMFYPNAAPIQSSCPELKLIISYVVSNNLPCLHTNSFIRLSYNLPHYFGSVLKQT